MTLAANNDPTAIITFGKSGAKNRSIAMRQGSDAVVFHGRNLMAKVTSKGETVINDPDSITLSGKVATRASVRGSRALFAWSSPVASVILEQPRSMPAPAFHDGAIDFYTQADDAPTTMAKHLEVEPVMDRCKACGTHPNSIADLDIYDCVPGDGVCYRCVSWECVAQES